MDCSHSSSNESLLQQLKAMPKEIFPKIIVQIIENSDVSDDDILELALLPTPFDEMKKVLDICSSINRSIKADVQCIREKLKSINEILTRANVYGIESLTLEESRKYSAIAERYGYMGINSSDVIGCCNELDTVLFSVFLQVSPEFYEKS